MIFHSAWNAVLIGIVHAVFCASSGGTCISTPGVTYGSSASFTSGGASHVNIVQPGANKLRRCFAMRAKNLAAGGKSKVA